MNTKRIALVGTVITTAALAAGPRAAATPLGKAMTAQTMLVTREDSSRRQAVLKKPMVEMKIESTDCGVVVVVNGCQVMRDMTGDPIDHVQPINPFVRHGANEFEVFALRGPQNGPDTCNLRFEVGIRDADAPPESAVTLATMVYDGAKSKAGKATSASSPAMERLSSDGYRQHEHGDVIIGELTTRILPHPYKNNSPALKRTITIPLPLPPWAFFKSDIMPTGWAREPPTAGVDRQLYDELMKAYREIWSALAAKDVKKLSTIFEERSREYDRALYLEPGTSLSRCMWTIKEMWNNKDNQLDSIDDEGKPWLVEARTQSKTVFLSFGRRASHILRYVPKDKNAPNMADVLPVWFRLENGKFIVTR
jgi:hypothetical protein